MSIYTQFKDLCLFLLLVLLSMTPATAHCGIWEDVEKSVGQSTIQTDYHQIRNHLNLLTSAQIAPDSSASETYLIGGGYIVLSPLSIRSYTNPGDYAEGKDPEFEFQFTDAKRKIEPSTSEVNITLDFIPSHPLFSDLSFGTYTYDQFLSQLQNTLANVLRSKGYGVSIMRPARPMIAQTIDDINSDPTSFVISTQFNGDEHEKMTTFAGGNIKEAELSLMRNRARLIQAALTHKHLHSAELAGYISKACHERLGVELLDWDLAYFPGRDTEDKNAIPVAISALKTITEEHLDSKDEYFNGIAMRNLMHNGIFAKAVAIPFPSMDWARSNIEAGNEFEFVNQYANAISAGFEEFLRNHSSL